MRDDEQSLQYAQSPKPQLMNLISLTEESCSASFDYVSSGAALCLRTRAFASPAPGHGPFMVTPSASAPTVQDPPALALRRAEAGGVHGSSGCHLFTLVR